MHGINYMSAMFLFPEVMLRMVLVASNVMDLDWT